jgi:hypothetical protein
MFTATTNRRSDESRTTASALPLSCYIVDDVTRPNMAYTEYSLVILSHIVLAGKFPITSREITIGSQSCDINWLYSYKFQAEFVAGLRNWIHAIFLRTLDPDVNGQKMSVPCFGGQYRHLTGPAGVGLLAIDEIRVTKYRRPLPHYQHYQWLLFTYSLINPFTSHAHCVPRSSAEHTLYLCTYLA